MIGFDDAIALVRSTAIPLGTESIALSKAAGRVASKAIVARIDSPRSAVSAMDGYAVRDEDLARCPVRLSIVGESFAGNGWNGIVARGTCARIFTGAPIPKGADRVVIQEQVARDGNQAIIDQAPNTSRHIRARGSDFLVGDELVPTGRLIGPRDLVAAAAADIANLDSFRQPHIAILSTGDELAAPGTAAAYPNAIPESLSFGIAALAAQWGAICEKMVRVRDDLVPMRSAAEALIEAADVVVVTGGASVGEKDFAKTAFEPLGLKLIFSKVAIKPGKPVWIGRVAERWIVGLPGNPTSALVTARLFLAPLLAALGGRAVDHALCWQSLPLGSIVGECGARETFHRARLIDRAAEILSHQDSSAQKALTEADLLIRQPANSPSLKAGDMVSALDF